ncbi:MAG TPA: hypothetical protein VJP59_10060 [Gemmatimonadota bacterium]|nr:hypothetical protein [Gemmatimonadota bacterium]
MTSTEASVDAVARLERLLALSADDTVERAYVFEPLERRDTSFSLVFVTRSCPDGRLEMVALGGRGLGGAGEGWDFVRRARFPRATLAVVLEEFIERCGVEGAAYREVDLLEGPEPGLQRLAELLAGPTGTEEASAPGVGT